MCPLPTITAGLLYVFLFSQRRDNQHLKNCVVITAPAQPLPVWVTAAVEQCRAQWGSDCAKNEA